MHGNRGYRASSPSFTHKNERLSVEKCEDDVIGQSRGDRGRQVLDPTTWRTPISIVSRIPDPVAVPCPAL
ncbi:hypothetical protein MJO28_012384 [Puccinia striiformis f. sp. tritici]|uniref:Uncharacterized protein n=1 Tax=Puccinia striiformis f. sp. tritici TaxID=168172 RepID=A0ACC0E073_9BASI|nr:hypothetical protein MJO28_012384 [Puccinia striiformis f. sp. tritici]KAI7945655.1 hypothetical protein MJO29_012043 [Puccinia striiformis f. sp. tritici]